MPSWVLAQKRDKRVLAQKKIKIKSIELQTAVYSKQVPYTFPRHVPNNNNNKRLLSFFANLLVLFYFEQIRHLYHPKKSMLISSLPKNKNLHIKMHYCGSLCKKQKTLLLKKIMQLFVWSQWKQAELLTTKDKTKFWLSVELTSLP